MVLNHSSTNLSVLLTGESAHIREPHVRELADANIRAQKKEIGEMKMYMQDLKNK